MTGLQILFTCIGVYWLGSIFWFIWAINHAEEIDPNYVEF